MFYIYIYRSTTDPVPKQSSIASISSNVPTMAASKNNDIQILTNTTTDVESLLNSFKTNTSMTTKKRFLVSFVFFFIIARDSKRVRTVCQPKGTIPYTV